VPFLQIVDDLAVVLMIKVSDTLPIFRDYYSIHATFYYSAGFKVKYNSGTLDIAIFGTPGDADHFVHLPIGSAVIVDD